MIAQDSGHNALSKAPPARPKCGASVMAPKQQQQQQEHAALQATSLHGPGRTSLAFAHVDGQTLLLTAGGDGRVALRALDSLEQARAVYDAGKPIEALALDASSGYAAIGVDTDTQVRAQCMEMACAGICAWLLCAAMLGCTMHVSPSAPGPKHGTSQLHAMCHAGAAV